MGAVADPRVPGGAHTAPHGRDKECGLLSALPETTMIGDAPQKSHASFLHKPHSKSSRSSYTRDLLPMEYNPDTASHGTSQWHLSGTEMWFGPLLHACKPSARDPPMQACMHPH